MPEINKYPGLFFIDAHQQTSGLLLPAQRGPGPPRDLALRAGLHPERDRPGAAAGVQRPVARSTSNYNSYDLFTPEYGDTVPVAAHGRGRHDVREGHQRGLRQAGLRPLPGDRHDDQRHVERQGQHPARDWVAQWGEAVDQGAGLRSCSRTSSSARCTTRSSSSRQGTRVRLLLQARPAHGRHGGADRALLQSTGVQRLSGSTRRWPSTATTSSATARPAASPTASTAQTLPAGTLWIPMDQGMKHWIQAAPGREPVHPVRLLLRRRAPGRYPLQRGLAGSGFLTKPMSAGRPDDGDHRPRSYGTAPAAATPVYAFNTDSARGLGARDRPARQGRQRLPRDRGRSRSAASSSTPAPRSSTARRWPAAAATSPTLAAERATRRSPACPSYPVPRRQLAMPKIGLYTGAAHDPVEPAVHRGPEHHGTTATARSSGGGVLRGAALARGQARAPGDPIDPGHARPTWPDNALVTERLHGVHQPGHDDRHHAPSTRARRSRRTGTALQTFINGGGIYIGTNADGATRRPLDRADRRSTPPPRSRCSCSRRARRSTPRSTPPTRSPGASTSAAGSTATRAATRC